MISIETIKSDIISEFSLFEDWMEKYEYIIELGKSIPLIDPKFKTDDNLIKGCQSKVWMHAEIKNNNVLFYADSDAIITKGIIAILIRVFSNQNPKNILESDTKFKIVFTVTLFSSTITSVSVKLNCIPLKTP